MINVFGSAVGECEALNEDSLNIPPRPSLSMNDVEHIISAIRAY